MRADKNRKTEKLDSYIKVLKEVVSLHVEEEEKELLPKANRELQEEQLEALATKMGARFAKALESDFRRPLNDAVQQLLMGKTKTTPKRSMVETRRRTPKTARAARSGRATARRAQSKRAKPRRQATQSR
jgi:hypothetical protein